MKERLFVFLLCAVLSAAAASPASSTVLPDRVPPTLVFVLAGQSNMAGRAFPLPAETPDPNVLTLTSQGTLIPALDPLGDLGQGTAAGNGAGVGPALTFGRTVAAQGYRVILLMCALGGSSASEWVPGGNLFAPCMARARAAEQYGRIGGILDIQGETDAENASDAALWSQRFGAFVAGARQTLGNVPLVYGQIGDVSTAIFPYRNEVQAEQAGMRIPDSAMIRTSDLAEGPDDVHFTVAAEHVVGLRFARAWLRLRATGALFGCERRTL